MQTFRLEGGGNKVVCSHSSHGSFSLTRYFKFREEIGAPLPQFPLIPAYVDGKWQKHQAALFDYNVQLKASFSLCGIANSHLFTSHSAKEFFLNLTAHHGLDSAVRKSLGY